MDRLAKQTRRYIVIDVSLIGVTLVVSILALWLGLASMVVLLVAGWFIVGLALMLVLYTRTQRKALGDYQRLTTHDVWAHWHYHQHEWKSITAKTDLLDRFARQATGWQPLLLRAARLYGMLAFFITYAVLIQQGLIAFAAALLAGTGVFLIFYRSAKRVEDVLRAPYPLHDNETSDVYIGTHGIVFPGSYILFTQPRLSIERISIEGAHPQQLHVGFVHAVSNQKIAFDLVLPIPIGEEDAAHTIRSRLSYLRAQSQAST